MTGGDAGRVDGAAAERALGVRATANAASTAEITPLRLRIERTGMATSLSPEQPGRSPQTDPASPADRFRPEARSASSLMSSHDQSLGNKRRSSPQPSGR